MYNGQLNQNEIFATLFNMIISEETFADNIYDTKETLADMSRVDGSLFGDSKLFYSTDVLRSVPWMNDAEAQNLLALHRPQAPEVQAVTINQFRAIAVTVDNYLSKRAFSTEGSFAAFNSQMLSWIRDTKRVYDSTLFNTFVGTNKAGMSDDGKGARQNYMITIPAEPDGVDDYNTESYNRIVAQTIAKSMADLLVDLEDVSRDFNDYGNLRSYNSNDLVFVWSSDWVNKITKMDMPTIFHKDGLVDKFAQHTLPERYFGNINTSGGTTGAANITVRSLIEYDYNEVEMNNPAYDESKHVFPGDLLPANTPYEANKTYTEDPSIIFKVYHKRSIPFMSAFETGTNFFNPRSLTDTHYLIFGYNDLVHLKNYPFITAKVQNAA